jgi:hypothetical protein
LRGFENRAGFAVTEAVIYQSSSGAIDPAMLLPPCSCTTAIECRTPIP